MSIGISALVTVSCFASACTLLSARVLNCSVLSSLCSARWFALAAVLLMSILLACFLCSCLLLQWTRTHFRSSSILLETSGLLTSESEKQTFLGDILRERRNFASFLVFSCRSLVSKHWLASNLLRTETNFRFCLVFHRSSLRLFCCANICRSSCFFAIRNLPLSLRLMLFLFFRLFPVLECRFLRLLLPNLCCRSHLAFLCP